MLKTELTYCVNSNQYNILMTCIATQIQESKNISWQTVLMHYTIIWVGENKAQVSHTCSLMQDPALQKVF